MVHSSSKQQLVVLATKLMQPRLPGALVARDRLLTELDLALSRRLTLVSASAGWGKTTLLASWLRQQELGVSGWRPATAASNSDLLTPSPSSAWFSLDELDNQPKRFWVGCITALRTCLPNIGALALAMLDSPEQPSLIVVLTALLNDLADREELAPLVLILDDFHVITDKAVHESLTFLLEHLPANLHVVLATRVDPDMPLARWRARGDLLEIRAADLRFTEEETSHFLTQTLGDTLENEDVQRLEQRTEGWVAGLQLAALALRQREDRLAFVQSFAGTHRYLMDYVQSEVLTQQEPHVQRFLIETAILRHLNAPLCAAVTSNTNSQALLESLERSNLFVVPLDDKRNWYRMHDLFREVLLARLQTSEPELVPQLHRRAARWYAAQTQIPQAIDHTLAANDFGYAGELIELAAPELWLHGEAETVMSWIAMLPDNVVQDHGRLALQAALRLLQSFNAALAETFSKTQSEVEHVIARVEVGLAALPQPERVLRERRIDLLRALIATRAALSNNDIEAMRPLAERSAALAEDEDLDWRLAALSISFWHVESLQRQGALLVPQLLQAKQQVIEAGNRLDIVRVMRMLAFSYVRAGRLRLFEQECLEGLALIKRLGEHSPSEGYFYLFLNWKYYLANQLDKAASAVQQALEIGQTWQHADLLVTGNVDRMRTAVAQGDHASAEQALLQAEALVEQERLKMHASVVAGARVEYWLATGNLRAAQDWAESVIFTPETWHPNRKWEFLLLVLVYLAQGRYEQACAALQDFSAHFDSHTDVIASVDFLSLQVLAFQGLGRTKHAQETLELMVALTATEGNIRAFLDAGEPMRQAVQELYEQRQSEEQRFTSVTRAFMAQLLHAFGQEAQRREHTLPAEHGALLVEPLTPREEEVLRLLASGASNAEIAARLVISLATVKKHVGNLFGKLGVATRTQAIARARDLPDFH